MIHATTWMNPGNTMLSEKRQSQKDHILYDFIFTKCPEQTNPHKKQVSGCLGTEKGAVSQEVGGNCYRVWRFFLS